MSLARAIADDLRASGLFEEVQFEGDDSPPATTYELRGILWDPRLTGTFTTFGLSFFALPLMLLPVPVEQGAAVARLDLRLIENSPGRTLWSYSLNETIARNLHTSTRHLAYGRHGAASLSVPIPPAVDGVNPKSYFFWHLAALRQGMASAKRRLAAALGDPRSSETGDPFGDFRRAGTRNPSRATTVAKREVTVHTSRQLPYRIVRVEVQKHTRPRRNTWHESCPKLLAHCCEEDVDAVVRVGEVVA